MYEILNNESHKGKLGTHRMIMKRFLNDVSLTYELECPARCGGQKENSVMFQPCKMTQIEALKNLVNSYPAPRKAVEDIYRV